MTNSVVQTDYLNNGINIQTDCSLTNSYANYGDIVFQNFTLQGERYLSINQPIIYLLTINNITINNSTFKSYAKRTDANKKQIHHDTVNNCKVLTNDGRYKLF